MTPDQLRDARATLGHMWGLNRPLHMSELGRAIGLSGADPGQSVRDYERGKTIISGPIGYLVALYLGGALPPCGLDKLRG